MTYHLSTIENVDLAIYKWVNEKLNLYAETNKGFNKVPVIWVTGERAWQVKHERTLRDKQNNFILPAITIERESIVKNKDRKGKYWGDVVPFQDEKGGSIAIHSVIQQEKTRNFANAYSKRSTGQPNFKKENKKIIYQTKYIPMPVYVVMNYVIDIKTEYQQQMNELLQPFITHTGAINYFIIEDQGHRYESFMDSNFNNKSNLNNLQQEERLFNTQIKIEVLAHLVGAGKNSDQPEISVRENIVEVKVPKEYVIFDQENITAPFPLQESPIDDDEIVIQTSDGEYLILD